MKKMGRHGENIRKRADGRWEARYIQYHNIDGKAVYRYTYGKTYLEAKQKRKQAMEETHIIPRGADAASKITFYKLTEEWLKIKKGQVKPSTYANYVNLIQKQLFPELGNLYVSSLTTPYLEQFLQKKLVCGRLDGKGGLSNKTVCDLRSLLKLILQYAKKIGYFCPSDLKFSISAGHPPKIEVLEKSELVNIEEILFAESKPLHLGILLALYGGLRIGEICALQWKDFCLEEGTVNVSKTVIRIKNTEENATSKTIVIIQEPKTEHSKRTIPLPDVLLPYFIEAKKEEEDFILTKTTRFMEPRVFLEHYKKILKKAGIKNYTFHALRHTFATRCVENNFDIKTLSEIMGHSNISITIQRYVHPSLEQKRVQMNKLSLAINQSQKSGQNF